MLTPIAYGLAIALDLLIMLIGGRFLIAPRAAAAGYGVPAKPAGDPAYLTIKGLRDGTYALVGRRPGPAEHAGPVDPLGQRDLPSRRAPGRCGRWALRHPRPAPAWHRAMPAAAAPAIGDLVRRPGPGIRTRAAIRRRPRPEPVGGSSEVFRSGRSSLVRAFERAEKQPVRRHARELIYTPVRRIGR
jgi:Domain of unknown function (DUF4267)